MSDPRITPTACEYQLAYELLKPAPWSKSPVQHLAELAVGYREGIVGLLEALELKWQLEADGEGNQVRRRADAFAHELRAVIELVRTGVPARAVRADQMERDQ